MKENRINGHDATNNDNDGIQRRSSNGSVDSRYEILPQLLKQNS